MYCKKGYSLLEVLIIYPQICTVYCFVISTLPLHNVNSRLIVPSFKSKNRNDLAKFDLIGGSFDEILSDETLSDETLSDETLILSTSSLSL